MFDSVQLGLRSARLIHVVNLQQSMMGLFPLQQKASYIVWLSGFYGFELCYCQHRPLPGVKA